MDSLCVVNFEIYFVRIIKISCLGFKSIFNQIERKIYFSQPILMNYTAGLRKIISFLGTKVLGLNIFCENLLKWARSVHHERKARSPYERGPGPALGPWKILSFRCSLVQSGPYFMPLFSKIYNNFHINVTKKPEKQILFV